MGDRMHIVYVTGAFAQSRNDVLEGMQFYVYKIVKYMKERGHDVTVLTVGSKEKRWNYKGISVYSAVIPYKVRFNNCFTKYIVYTVVREGVFNKALHEIDKVKPISLVQYAGWYGVGMLYDRTFPSVLRISTYVKAQLAWLHTPAEIALIAFAEKRAARNFNGVIAPSKILADIYRKETGRMVRIMETPYYSLDIAQENDILYRTELVDKKYFLFFGRISQDKGVYTIARVLEKLLRKYPEYYFCFAGNNYVSENVDTMQMIKTKAGCYCDRVMYLGALTHELLFPVIRNAECIVMPSLMDNLPNACMEALELNGIVIGTRGASFDEIFEDGISGFLIKIDDSDELMQKIDDVVQMTEDERKRMRWNAKLCLRKYKPQITGRKLEKYYYKLLACH